MFSGVAERYRQIENEHRIANDWLVPPRPGDRRRMTRARAAIAASFRRRGHRRQAVSVDQMSPVGCRIAPAGCLSVGSYAWITFPSIEGWYSRVAWCAGDAAGLDFTQPLHPAVARMIIERSESL